MPAGSKIKLAATPIVLLLVIADFALQHRAAISSSRVRFPDLVELRPGTFRYRLGGEFTRDGRPVAAPIVAVRFTGTFGAMRHQVSIADYDFCVEAGACPAVDHGAGAPQRPVVKVNWHDAETYAAWLSKQTGVRFRLPTDAEWAYAAGGRFADDALPSAADGGDPGRRALAIYDRDARRDQTVEIGPQLIGSFGVNENGLLDVAGSVWEWTDSCFVRAAIDADGEIIPTTTNCGVRIVEGRHRTYMTDFIRDPRNGGCSVGAPPANLGFRLVSDEE